MKKSFAILFLTAACTTLSSPDSSSPKEDGGPKSALGVRNEIDGLEDISFEYVESTWGVADAVTNGPGGGKTVVFKNIHATAEDPDADKPVHKLCDIELKVDAEGTVVNWDYKTCKAE